MNKKIKNFLIPLIIALAAYMLVVNIFTQNINTLMSCQETSQPPSGDVEYLPIPYELSNYYSEFYKRDKIKFTFEATQKDISLSDYYAQFSTSSPYSDFRYLRDDMGVLYTCGVYK